MQEIKKLQQFKRQEIEEKIEKLKEITGNTDLEFKGEDLESDFDPEAHDKRMQSLFNEDFYEGPEEEQKPVFPDIDEYLQLGMCNLNYTTLCMCTLLLLQVLTVYFISPGLKATHAPLISLHSFQII